MGGGNGSPAFGSVGAPGLYNGGGSGGGGVNDSNGGGSTRFASDIGAGFGSRPPARSVASSIHVNMQKIRRRASISISNAIEAGAHVGEAVKSAKISAQLRLYKVPVLFTLAMGCIWAYIFAYRIWLDVKTPFYSEGGKMWLKCLMRNHAAGISAPTDDPRVDTSMITARYYNSRTNSPNRGCGDSFPAFLHVNFARAVAALCAAQGALLFLTFCNGSTLRLWTHAAHKAIEKARNRARGREFQKASSKAAQAGGAGAGGPRGTESSVCALESSVRALCCSSCSKAPCTADETASTGTRSNFGKLEEEEWNGRGRASPQVSKAHKLDDSIDGKLDNESRSLSNACTRSASSSTLTEI
jgi:hypothetical protein